MPGSCLSSSLPLPFFPLCPPLFPLLVISSRPPLPLLIAPLSSSTLRFASLRADPPYLSPLVFVGVVSPRLQFPSTVWTLIPPVRTTSAHVFFAGVLVFIAWWGFLPRPLFCVVGGLPIVAVARLLSASAFFLFLCVFVYLFIH
jgi:hypothetical protein